MDILPDYIFYNDENMTTGTVLKEKLEGKKRYLNRLSVYNKYSEKNNIEEMSGDQIDKLKKCQKGTYFLISWTLTQSPGQAVKGSPSIIELARKADEHAGRLLRSGVVTAEKFPNVFYVDNIVNNRPALLSMMINYKVNAPQMLGSLPPFFCLSNETSTTHWGNSYNAVVPFEYNNRWYYFAHTNTNKKWFVAELAPYNNVIDKEIISGNWGNYFPFAVPFKFNNEYYMFAQTDAKKKWYISRREPWSTSVEKELVNGTWKNFYPTMVSFRYNNKPYLFAQTQDSGHKCFISELSLDGNIFNRELITDYWGNFYGTAVAFEYKNEPYLFAQTSGDNNKFFVSKLNPFDKREFNTELISGTWGNYYDKACVFTSGSKIYIMGITFSSSKKVFVSELICTI